MNWRIAGATLEGAMRMLDGESPFARAAPILRFPDRRDLLRAQRWTDGEPTGDPLSEADFKGFVRSNQAFRWSDLGAGTVGAVPHIAVWLLRGGFDHFLSHDDAVDEVRRAGAVIADVPAPASRVRVVAIREDLANPVRDEWATRAFDRAFQEAMKGDWQAACATADLSFVVTRGLVPERVALYALALEKCGEKTDAEATLTMAEQSRDKAFGLQMRAKLEEYRRDTAARPESRVFSLPVRNGEIRKAALTLKKGVYKAQGNTIKKASEVAA